MCSATAGDTAEISRSPTNCASRSMLSRMTQREQMWTDVERCEKMQKDGSSALDDIQSMQRYDPCTPRDTCHPMHTASARKACKVPAKSTGPLLGGRQRKTEKDRERAEEDWRKIGERGQSWSPKHFWPKMDLSWGAHSPQVSLETRSQLRSSQVPRESNHTVRCIEFLQALLKWAFWGLWVAPSYWRALLWLWQECNLPGQLHGVVLRERFQRMAEKLFSSSLQDKSHLQTGGPWTAR